MTRILVKSAVTLSSIFAVASLHAAPIVDQSNLLDSGFGWTAMSFNKVQTFQPGLPILSGIDIDILTANPQLGDDTITIEIVRDGQVLSTASQSVSVGFEGLLRFDLPEDLHVNVGDSYGMSIPGTKDTFGWKFSGGDTYPNGIRSLGGSPQENTDWLFQTYGVPEPASCVLSLWFALVLISCRRPHGRQRH